MWQSSLVAWPLSCSHSTNAWTSRSKTASEGSTWRGWLADRLSTLHPVRRRRRQETLSFDGWMKPGERSQQKWSWSLSGPVAFQMLWTGLKTTSSTTKRDRRSTMTKTSSRLRAKARVTQMASKLYCQLKALYKTAPLGATNSIKVQWPTVLICVSCLLCFITGNLATSRFRNLRDISFGFDIWEKNKIDQTLGYKPNPLVWTLFGRLKSKSFKK